MRDFVFDLQRFDNISNDTSNTLVSGTSGNDSIYSGGYSSVTIDAGAGNDCIENDYWTNKNISLNGGAGNDTLYTRSDGGRTLTGGTGYDLFWFYYDSDTIYGTDIITDYAEEDTIRIDNVEVSSITTSGNNVIIAAGNNSLRINNAVGKVITYIDSDGTQKTYGEVSKLIRGTSGADSINNTVEGATIEALGGKDTINNSGDSVLIDGGDGADTIYSNGYYVTINAGAGNDTIDTYNGIRVTINAGDGNDFINNSGTNATINAGDDDDYIYNRYYGGTQSLNGGTGNDTLHTNSDGGKTLTGGSGSDLFWFYYDNDTMCGTDVITDYAEGDTIRIDNVAVSSITESGNNVIIAAGDNSLRVNNAVGKVITYIDSDGTQKTYGEVSKFITLTSGNDTYGNSVSGVTISALGGNDSVKNFDVSAVSINGGAGNDDLSNRGGNNVTLTGGDGKDSLWNEPNDGGEDALNISIVGGAGDDSINNFGNKATLSGGTGNDTIRNYGAGYRDGELVFDSVGQSVKIYGDDGDDYIFNSGDNVTINADADKDTIHNDGSNVSINAGTGNDYIENNGASVTISAGDGSDTIDNSYVNNILVNAGAGNDSISNDSAWYSTINGGDGNDTIVVPYRAYQDSINGGAGNDRISLISGTGDGYYGNNTVKGGTGNDTIYGNADATVGSVYQYSQGDGKDIIYGLQELDLFVVGNGSSDTFSSVKSGNNIIITVGEGKISLMGAVSLSTVNILGTYKNPLLIRGTSDADSIYNTLEGATINALGGNDTILNDGGASVSVNGGAGNDSIYSLLKGTVHPDSCTLIGGDGNDTIWNDGEKVPYGGVKVLIDGGNDDDNISNDGENSTILGGSGNDYISNWGAKSSIDGGDGNDIIHNQNDSTEKTASKVTITGGVGNDSIKNFGLNVTINGNSGDDTIRSYGGVLSKIYGGTGNDWILNGGNTSNNNTIWATQATLSGGDGSDTFYSWSDSVSVSGDADNDWIFNNSDYVTITGGAGDDSVSLTADAENNLILYTAGDGNDSISGFNSTTTLQIGGGTGTYSSQTSGKNIIVTVGKGKISLMGAASLSAVNIDGKEATKNEWKLDGTTATYGTSSNTLIKVTNVKSLAGINLSGNVVTIAKASVNAKKITLTGSGYTLKLADDVTKRETKPAAWSYSSGTATYKSSYKTKGYLLASKAKSISYYSKATTASTLATVKGVKSKDGLNLSGKVITVAKASVNAKKITLTGDGYTLKLADDVIAPTTKKAAWSYSGGTATYKSSYKTAGYTLASNAKSISYTKATTALTLASVKGAVSKTGLSVSGKKIKLKKSALSSKVTVSGGDYEFDFASDYGTATIVGSSKADTITVRGKKVSINAGKGDDTIKMLGTATVNGGAGADTFVYQSGKHVIKNYAEEDKISITSGTAEIASSGDNIIFTVGSGKITVTGGKDKTISYIDESGERTYLTQSTQPVIIKGKKITLTEDYLDATFNVADYGAALQTIDASAAQRNLKITGNALKNLIKGTDDDDTIDGGASADIIDGGKGNDSILGDTGNDSIFGGAGDDTIIGGAGTDSLTGGTGADVFVWNKGDGNDKITDCKEEDTILINGDTVSTIKASTDKKDLIFTLASKSTITLTGGADKIISYTDAKGEHVHSQFVKFTDKGTSATLAEGYPNKTFDQSNYSKYADDLATINASKVQHEMIILGNGKANSIMGTKEDDTINGFAGKDILLGNDGNDSLNGGTGNDKLYGGTGNDTLWGNAGNDSLWGGHGEDVFIYKPSEDTDRIFDYDFHYDKIMLLSGTVDNVAEIDEDIVFTIGTGKIILDRAAGKYAKVVDSSGKLLKDTTNMR